MGAGGHRAPPLPAERTAVGQRRHGGLAGAAPAGVRLDVGRLDPGRLEREGPVALGHLDRVRQGHRAVATLDPSAPGPGGAEGRGERRIHPELDQRAGRHRVVGEAAPTEDHVGPRRLESRPLELGPPRGQHRIPWMAGERARRAVDAQRAARGLHDGLPARAPAQMGAQGRLDAAARRWPTRARRFERSQPEHDAGSAEAALAGPVLDEGGGPAVAQHRRRSLEGGDVAARDAADGRHAGDAGCPVDPHGAAAALALRAAAVLDRAAAELVAQRVQEADPVGDSDRVPVEHEGDGHGRGRANAGGLLGGGRGSAQGARGPELS